MNDTRFRSCRCGGNAGSRRRGAFVAVWSGMFCCLIGVLATRGGATEGGREMAAASVPVGGGAAETEARMEEEGSKLVKATLVSQHRSVDAGGETWLGVRFEIKSGWHTYWRNAGDSGMPPTFEFSVEPAGALEIGAAQWPVPERHLSAGDILDYVYEGSVVHLFKARVSSGLKTGETIRVVCRVSWLVCKEACLPGEGEIALEIGVGEATEADEARRLAEARETLPTIAGDRLTSTWKGDALEVRDNWSGGAPIEFYPFADDGDLIPNDLVTAGGSRSGMLRFHFDGTDLKRGGVVRGVVRVEHGQRVPDAGTRGYLLEVPAPRRVE